MVERMQGRLTAPQHYRLPTTAEWDHARGTDTPGLEYRKEALDVTDLVIKTYNGKG